MESPLSFVLTRRELLRILGATAGVAVAGRQGVVPALGAQSPARGGVADWPEVGGRGRRNVWTEGGILETFPKDGLKVLWRTPVRVGFAGPAVTDGRVFLLDWVETKRPTGY